MTPSRSYCTALLAVAREAQAARDDARRRGDVEQAAALDDELLMLGRLRMRAEARAAQRRERERGMH